ncbi:MAG: CHAT domain-containing protein, partial [Acidobacteriota bacterium]
GPGQRAGDYYRLARVLLDGGDANGAWGQLAALDRLAESERARLRCREQASHPEAVAQWRQNDQRRQRLLDQLVALEVPASGLRQAQLRPVRQSLMQELQQLSRQWPGCSRAETPPEGHSADFRALALDDEILLLHRRKDGKVVLDHRTPMPRRQGRRWINQLTRKLQRGAVTEEDWRPLLAPLAEALVPRLQDDLGEVTVFSLHGWLQDVPLAALPVVGAQGGWLSDLTTPALRPAGLSKLHPSSDGADLPLFVVDPRGDLRGGRQLLSFYSLLFPQARIVAGDAANRRSLRKLLPSASFLHVDAHGLYNAAFGELSRLQMSDGSLTLLELAELPSPRRFVNLSGCQTGRWPVTADSGRYGMAGVFARGGASWVIASRSDLNDRLASDFNQAFYQSIAAGSTVPQAFQAALEQVRPKHPPSAWASLMLVRGAGM